MNKFLHATGLALALLVSPLALAEEAAVEDAAAVTAVAEEADKPVVSLQATGDHVVAVNTGNETVDAAANYAARCTERAAAFKACESMGGLKAIACRKTAEIRYKSATNCPNL